MIIDSESFKLKPASFVVFEGGNAVGKSKLINNVCSGLNAKGIAFVSTKEPGGSPVGLKIRDIVRNDSEIKIDPLTELLLFCADRAQHVKEIIKPGLKDNKFVLCDRYIYSTLAYQGQGRNLDMNVVKNLIDISTDKLKPDLVVLIDLPVEVSLTRIKHREVKETDRFELEDINYFNQVRNSFLNQAKETREPWIVLDGTNQPEVMLKKVLDIFF